MISGFEKIIRQILIRKDSELGNTEFIESIKEINVTLELRKILDKVAIGMIIDSFESEEIIDAMLKLARMERIIIAFNIIAQLDLAEISYLLDTSMESTYAQKSTALKRLKEELSKVS